MHEVISPERHDLLSQLINGGKVGVVSINENREARDQFHSI